MFKRLNKLYEFGKLPWLIIGWGIILRVVQYLYNRSLYIDEARDTVVGILGRTFSDLFKPPPPIHTPTSLPGFFVIEKVVVHVFGDSEYALRLFPLLAGIISLALFYFVAKQYIKPKAIPWALVLFTTSEPLIYYSSFAKPYSIDVSITLLIYLTAIYIHSARLTISRVILFGVIGAVAVWFSSPSVFILAGVGTSMALFSLIRGEWSRVGNLLIAYLLWLLSFALCYFLYLRILTNNEYFLNAFKGEGMFMPLPPLSFSDLTWYIKRFFEIFKETAGFLLPGIAASFFIMGCVIAFLEKKEKFFILISPIFFALLASGLTLYPFRHRTVLFFVPALLLLISEGIEYVREKTAQNTPLIGIVLVVLLLFHPVLSSVYHLFSPIRQEEIKPVLSHVRKNWQEGDFIYLHYRAHPAFEYYRKRYNFNKSDYIVGLYAGDKTDYYKFSVDYLEVYKNDLDKLKGKKRVWIVFTYTPLLNKGIDEKVFFTYYLNTIGKQIDSFKSVEASVYLYDLSEKALSEVDLKDSAPKELHWNF
jgi:hypothetical protein